MDVNYNRNDVPDMFQQMCRTRVFQSHAAQVAEGIRWLELRRLLQVAGYPPMSFRTYMEHRFGMSPAEEPEELVAKAYDAVPELSDDDQVILVKAIVYEVDSHGSYDLPAAIDRVLNDDDCGNQPMPDPGPALLPTSNSKPASTPAPAKAKEADPLKALELKYVGADVQAEVDGQLRKGVCTDILSEDTLTFMTVAEDVFVVPIATVTLRENGQPVVEPAADPEPEPAAEEIEFELVSEETEPEPTAEETEPDLEPENSEPDASDLLSAAAQFVLAQLVPAQDDDPESSLNLSYADFAVDPGEEPEILVKVGLDATTLETIAANTANFDPSAPPDDIMCEAELTPDLYYLVQYEATEDGYQANPWLRVIHPVEEVYIPLTLDGAQLPAITEPHSLRIDDQVYQVQFGPKRYRSVRK